MSQLVMGSLPGTATRGQFRVVSTGRVGRQAGSIDSRSGRIRWTRVITLLLLIAIAVAGSAAVLGRASARPIIDHGDGAAVVGRDPALREHVVAPGDTIWAVAQDMVPDSDPRELVDRITRLNGLSGVDVQVGTVLLLPAHP